MSKIDGYMYGFVARPFAIEDGRMVAVDNEILISSTTNVTVAKNAFECFSGENTIRHLLNIPIFCAPEDESAKEQAVSNILDMVEL